MATRVIDDSKLNDIAVAIQAKDNGGQMTVDEMPDRIENIPSKQSTGRIIYSDFDEEGLPHTMEYVPLSTSDTKLPDQFISYGHQYTIVKWNSEIENIICPNHITELGIGGFSINAKSKKLSNYDSLKIVGNNAFDGSIGRWSYDHLPPNLEYVGANAFARYALGENSNKFQIPDSVYFIGNNAFCYQNVSRDSDHLLSLPLSLKNLGSMAFYQIGSQSFPDEIIIPPLVETIGSDVFGGSAYLTTTITFQGTPLNIDANAFQTVINNNGTMKSLTTINVPWAEGEVANAPWGAINATVNYNYTGE